MLHNRCETGEDQSRAELCKYLESEGAVNGLRSHTIEAKPRHMQHHPSTDNLMRVCGLLISLLVFSAELCVAASSMPGESSPRIFHTITHLHPAAYLILFLIFVLSLANLVFQGFLSFSGWPFLQGVELLRKLPFASLKEGTKRRRRTGPNDSTVNRQLEDAVMAVRRVGKTPSQKARIDIPTPLDGVNHPMPVFGQNDRGGTGLPRMVESPPEKRTLAQEFKFSSAVDIPSPEEVERREKEQLVVSGIVKGPDGKGIESAIVFLTDLEGNRVGQSCRSMHDTGEFKVLMNEPGKYILSGYKRGYIMESAEPLVLPIESGKIDGLTLRMIPEGCVVQGRVVLDAVSNLSPNFEVKCVCGEGAFSRAGKTDATGEFRIPGVLANSKCYIEVRGSDGSLLTKTDPFETVQRKEIYREVQIRTPIESNERQSAKDWDEEVPDEPRSPGSNAAG